jgi:Ca2+-transporting ATPase
MNGPRVRLVRARVAGRARLQVVGLKGNAALKRRLEASLPGRAGIHRAQGSVTTGNLLVLFDPGFDPDRALNAVVEAVVTAVAGSPETAGAAPGAYRGADEKVVPFPRRPETAAGAGGADWHMLALEAAAARLRTSLESGLDEGEAAAALETHGRNELQSIEPRSDIDILVDQVNSLPVKMLLGSALLSVATGGVVDAVAILAVVAANAGIGFATERQAEREIDALSEIEPPEATVVRGGRARRITAAEVVPGDVLELAPGMLVAADGRLITALELTVDEAALTGESLPAAKRAGDMTEPGAKGAALADRFNMVYRGTAVTGGSARALAVATGPNSEVGRIQALVGATARRETPLQIQLDRMGRQLSVLTFGAAGLALLAGLLHGRRPLDMLKTAVSLGVAALPEGLPTIATVTLALGMRTMKRRKVLVRRLDAMETLGSVGVICFDKTGTLTENRITARAVVTPEREYDVKAEGLILNGQGTKEGADGAAHGHLRDLLTVAVLCNDTEIDGDGDGRRLKGSATEAALIELAFRAGVDVAALATRYPRTSVQYRTLNRRYMATRHRLEDGRQLVAVKGDPANVVELCGEMSWGEDRMPLGLGRRRDIEARNEDLASRGLRVLGLASGIVGPDDDDAPLGHLTWHGMVGLADPTRQGMPALIEAFHRAGIRTVMITGDQGATAYAVARELNLAPDETIEVLEGGQLERMDPDVLAGLAQTTHVFARVTPANKLQIVQALQKGGAIVAMTGDGINDSPALRAANIGVAMGSGSEAAHQVAEVILGDDRIESMPVAIALGRQTYSNIRRSLRFLLSTNMSEIMVTVLVSALGGQPPSPLQLLWINLVTDVFPALALGLEPPAPDVLERPPRDPDEPILGASDFRTMSVQAAGFSLAALVSQGIGTMRYGQGPEAAGMGFTTLTVSQLLHAISSRSERVPVTGYGGLRPNRYLTRAVAGLLGMQLAVSVFPPARRLLGLQRLGALDLVTAGALSLAPFFAVEASKLLVRDRPVRDREERP